MHLRRRARSSQRRFKTAEEGRAPGTDGEQAAEEDDCVDGEASGAVPVCIRFEVEPEGELVEGEGGSDAIADRHEAAEEDGDWRVGPAEVHQPSVAYQQKDEDSPDEVVNVHAMHNDPLEMSLMVDDPVDENPDSDKGDKEGDRGDEHAASRAVGDGGADEESDAGELQQDQEENDDEAGEGQQQECSGSGHTLLNHCWRRFGTGKLAMGMVAKA